MAVTIANPLGEDFSIMRTVTFNGMLTSLATNLTTGEIKDSVYSTGKCLSPQESASDQVGEKMTFTLGMYDDGDFYDMKGVVEDFFDKAGMHKKAEYDPKAGKPFLHPGRQAEIRYEGEVMGYLGEVHPAVAANYGIGTRAYLAVLDIPAVVEKASFDRKYTGLQNIRL